MKNRNKKVIQIIALVLCTILILVYAAPSAQASGKAGQSNEKTKVDSENLLEKGSGAGEGKTEKDETVYVFTDAAGKVEKIIVSDWLKNTESLKTIDDYSDLKNIENLKGYETFEVAGNHEQKWDAEGNDIYYQGTTEKPLPVGMKITYRLDGKKTNAGNIKGKSGHINIRFDFTNNEYEMREIDGKEVKIYVPFTVITGMILNNDKFENVELKNARLVNDGDKTIVIGTTFPGLQEDLNIDKAKFEFPDYFEIDADVTDFEMASTMTLATNEFVNDFDRNKLENKDFDPSKIDELKDGMDKLVNGSDALYDGLNTLLDSCITLKGGMDELTDGCAKLRNGANDLNNGASSLQKGASDLKNGLDTLKSNNDTLNNGAKQVFETLLAEANRQISASGLKSDSLTIENYDATLDALIKGLDQENVYNKARTTVEAKIDAMGDNLYRQYLQSIADSVYSGYLKSVEDGIYTKYIENNAEEICRGYLENDADALAKLTEEQKNAIKKAAKDSLTDEQKAMILEGAKASLTEEEKAQILEGALKTLTDEEKAGIREAAIEKGMQSDEVKNALNAANEGVKQLAELKGQLDAYKEFYNGLKAYTGGVARAADGAGQLKNGTDSLKSGTNRLAGGANDLYNGAATIDSKMPELVDGVTKLKNGSRELSDGVDRLNKEGVEKLTAVIEEDLEGITDRVKAILDVSDHYTTYSGKQGAMNGQVKFVYKTGSIE